MKRFAAALMVVIMLFTVAIPKQEAHADPITITALSAAAYTMAQAAGLGWAFTSGTSAGAQSYMEDVLTKWTTDNGGISIFGTTPVKAIAGKLAIAQQAYNSLKDFINDFITDNSLQETPTSVCAGFAGGVILNAWNYSFGTNLDGFHLDWTTNDNAQESANLSGYYYPKTLNASFVFTFGYGNTTWTQNFGAGWYWARPIAWRVRYTGNNAWYFDVLVNKTKSDTNVSITQYTQNYGVTINGITISSQISATVPQSGMDYASVLTGEQWVADVGAAPDTNIDQLIPEVFSDVANNDLVISDEEVTTDTPATPAPTSVPDTNIGQLIGNIDSTVSDISGTLEGVGEQVGAISETLEGVGTGVGAISEALTVPSAADAQSLKLPDLRTLFPFCIPFDLYNIVTAFNVEPQAPHVQIPFNIPAIGLQYTFDLDFSDFNGVAQICRTMEFVAFAVGLAILTSKVIRW